MVEENDRIKLPILEIIEYILSHSYNHWHQGSGQDARSQLSGSLHIMFYYKERDDKNKYIRQYQ